LINKYKIDHELIEAFYILAKWLYADVIKKVQAYIYGSWRSSGIDNVFTGFVRGFSGMTIESRYDV
jgi:hypothetical protein